MATSLDETFAETLSDSAVNLLDHLISTGGPPVIFVGSGLSRRYLNLPNWEELLKELADHVAISWEELVINADGAENKPEIASLIAEELRKDWFRNPSYKQIQERHTVRRPNRQTPLKMLVASLLDRKLDLSDLEEPYASEIALFKDAVFDLAITTNYDSLIETLRPELTTYNGQRELMTAPSQGISELYKIHGSVSDPQSLVITAEDYEEFNERNQYLMAKLLTLFVERPVIFLGYSLSDRNMASMIRNIRLAMGEDQVRFTDRLIFMKWDRSVVGPSFETGYTEGIEVRYFVDRDFRELFKVLGRIKRPMPAKLIRFLKEEIYKLAITGDPQQRITALDIEKVEDYKDLDVVIGIGVADKLGTVGYSSLTRVDLALDILGEKSLDPDAVVSHCFPQLFSKSGRFPLFKSLHRSGYLDQYGNLKNESVHSDQLRERVRTPLMELRATKSSRNIRSREFEIVGHSVARAFEEFETYKALEMVTMAPPNKLDINLIVEYLKSTKDEAFATGGPKSQWFKLICFIDRVKWGPENEFRPGKVFD